MFFTYTASVVLISLAIYGLLCLLQDLWRFYHVRSLRLQAGITLLILVKDAENHIEYLLHDLIDRLERTNLPCDAVIVDCGSEDLTYEIAVRMMRYSSCLEVFRAPAGGKAVSEALPLCRGNVIHVLDLVSRLAVKDCMPMVNQLLWPDGQVAGRA